MNQKELSSDHFYLQWILGHSLLNIITALIVVWMNDHRPLLLFNIVSFGFYLSYIRRFLIGYPLLIGYANWITIIRLLLLFILGFSINKISNISAFIGFGLVIIIDGLDGFVARKFNQQSEYGGRLDMECDALLVLYLSLVHINRGSIPFWILLPGGMRFLFGVLTYFVRSPREFTSHMFRATIAVFFFISLLLVFILPDYWSTLIVSISGSFIMLSFGLSIYAIIYNQIKKRFFHNPK